MNWEVFLTQLVAPLLGTSVPVFLGLLLFDRQKKGERLTRLHEEKRRVYSLFVSKYSKYCLARASKSFAFDSEIDMSSYFDVCECSAQVSLYAPKDVVELVEQACGDPTSENLPSSREIAKKMRDDLGR